jgi:pimeloyl-ACP methyl ester carboxylesterase
MQTFVRRQAIRFSSGDAECAAWHYPGVNGACVVMAAGFGVPKEPGTDRFAARFHAAGFGVLAFDYRGFGESGGTPRQVVRIRAQLADWAAALEAAAALPGVDPTRLAAWSFSASAGHVVRIAARTPGLAAAIAQTPTVDGRVATRSAGGYQTRGALLRTGARAVLDLARAPFGLPPLLLPLVAVPGRPAVLTTPDGVDADRALDPDGVYENWPRTVAARSILGLPLYRPIGDAARVACPLLVVSCDEDRSAPAGPDVEVAHRAPRGELLRLPGGHYAPFLAGFEKVVTAEIAFLRRHLLAPDAGTL